MDSGENDREESSPIGAQQKIANARRYADEGQQTNSSVSFWKYGFSLNPIFIILLIGFGALFYNSNDWRAPFSKKMLHPPASPAPAQRMLAIPEIVKYKGYRITEVASYTMTARVLSHERYYFGRESDLAPIDLALGWSLMTNDKVLSKISITQGGRFYRWYISEYPIPEEQIISSSANNHIIPATDEVRKTVESLYTGQWVMLTGYLVNVSAPDGWQWNTSLSRTDTGPGSCELFYVETAQSL